MHQPDDWFDPTSPKPTEPAVSPTPVGAFEAVGGDAFPQQRIANRTNSKISQAIEVAFAIGVSALLQLIGVPIANSVDRTFDAAPQLERRVRAATHVAAPPGSGE
jgi:hypothetical protein